MSYKVESVEFSELENLLSKIRGPENRNARRTVALQGGMELKGSFSLVCKDARSGEIEWEHSQDNLLTDYGRRYWMETKFAAFRLAFCPSTEAPNAGRYAIPTDSSANASFYGATSSPTNAPATNTKTISTTFGTPSANRTLGTIAILANNFGDGNVGPTGVLAFALLTPAKTQTTTQTLEVVYKISMNPIA